MLEQWDTAEGYGVLSEKANVRFQGPKQGSDMLGGGVDLESRMRRERRRSKNKINRGKKKVILVIEGKKKKEIKCVLTWINEELVD